MIDLKQLFEDYNIDYWDKGKNCTPNHINIRCIYCGDKSNHLGINIYTGNAICWKCGGHGKIHDVLSDLLEINLRQSKIIIGKYKTDLIINTDKKEKTIPDELELPKDAKSILPRMHREYLIGRGFDPDELQKKYKLLACDFFGPYKFRLIIPIFFKHRLVNFAGISVAGASLKVLNCPKEKAIIQRDSLVYNFDNIQNRKAIIVEGFVDCWKMGDSCIATLGTKFTAAQINLISKACDETYIMYDSESKDPDAPTQAEKLANQLSGLIKKVEVVYLDKGDPGDLSLAEAKRIKADLLN